MLFFNTHPCHWLVASYPIVIRCSSRCFLWVSLTFPAFCCQCFNFLLRQFKFKMSSYSSWNAKMSHFQPLICFPCLIVNRNTDLCFVNHGISIFIYTSYTATTLFFRLELYTRPSHMEEVGLWVQNFVNMKVQFITKKRRREKLNSFFFFICHALKSNSNTSFVVSLQYIYKHF